MITDIRLEKRKTKDWKTNTEHRRGETIRESKEKTEEEKDERSGEGRQGDTRVKENSKDSSETTSPHQYQR